MAVKLLSPVTICYNVGDAEGICIRTEYYFAENYKFIIRFQFLWSHLMGNCYGRIVVML
jgi:hypothetical protein